jgi:Ion channel
MRQAPLARPWAGQRSRSSGPARGAGSPGRAGSSPPEARYGLLLALLIVSYLLSASGLGALVTDIQSLLFLGVLVLALRTGPRNTRMANVAFVVALIGTVAATVALLTHTPDGEGAADIWKGLVLLLTAAIIVRRVLAKPTVTVQSIYGALSAYLIIGLMFAAFFAAFQHLGTQPFFAHHEKATTQTLQYFSFTTLTTLGYGDYTAGTNGGQALAVIEALTGQVFLATLVARLVAAYRAPSSQEAPAADRVSSVGQTRPRARRRWPPSSVRRRTPAGHYRKPPGPASQTRTRPPHD